MTVLALCWYIVKAYSLKIEKIATLNYLVMTVFLISLFSDVLQLAWKEIRK